MTNKSDHLNCFCAKFQIARMSFLAISNLKSDMIHFQEVKHLQQDNV